MLSVPRSEFDRQSKRLYNREMNMSVLTKGDSDRFRNMRRKRHWARINGWFNDNIYSIKEMDASYKKSAKKESERNKNRFSIISNQDASINIVDTIFRWRLNSSKNPSSPLPMIYPLWYMTPIHIDIHIYIVYVYVYMYGYTIYLLT